MNQLSIRKALNKAFLKDKPDRENINLFKNALHQLLQDINTDKREEFNKNLLADFLKTTVSKSEPKSDSEHFINTKGDIDLVIHEGKTAKTPVAVMIEVKRPANKAEMPTQQHLNCKAFQELLLYYLRERIKANNLAIKKLIITDTLQWFVFDATEFEKHFANDKTLVKQFEAFEDKQLASATTDFFYKKIAKAAIEKVQTDIAFTYFNLDDYRKIAACPPNDKAEKGIIPLFKTLSPEHLLKLKFANDSNTLDRKFYTELLHLIGLHEVGKTKKTIERLPKGKRNNGSLLETTITKLATTNRIRKLDNAQQYGNTHEAQTEAVALELVITWVNRILFLKLLEGQLLTYHNGDKAYAFLNFERLPEYDEVASLFFEVLAIPTEKRSDFNRKCFPNVPYLNSSLFEETELEENTINIDRLRDIFKIPILSTTVLKDNKGNRQTGELRTLEYLFAFLDAYDFATEGKEAIQEKRKTIINASVLGLIFEKINGYKDGSFFTPGFITMYMCRETLRRAVIQKFNEVNAWNCQTFNDLYNKIRDIKAANEVVNSLKICDPAVGSGHFLVSALNEMIAIKYDLGILQDENGRGFRDYRFEVENDELVVWDEQEDKLFQYNPNSTESQRIQKTLFQEKQRIIENCLLGVDINPNSVKICRLRLWIELLKNAFYKNDKELETLPNIDINIKCGNSLISRFALDTDLKAVLKKNKSKWDIFAYRNAIATYRNAEDKAQKQEMLAFINTIKSDFQQDIYLNDPKNKLLKKLMGDRMLIENKAAIGDLFEKLSEKDIETDLTKVNRKIKKLEQEIQDIKENKIYQNAFEWRFEFPEVLNDEGDFIGFDVVIGNPPYVFAKEASFEANYKKYVADFLKSKSVTTKSKGLNIQTGKINLFGLFMVRSFDLLKQNGEVIMIIPNNILRATTYEAIRKFFLEKVTINQIVDLGANVFPDATVSTIILSYENIKPVISHKIKILKSISNLKNGKFELNYLKQNFFYKNVSYTFNILVEAEEVKIIEKIQENSYSLDNYFKYISPGIDGSKDKFVSSKKLDDRYKPLLYGKNFSRYSIEFSDNYILYDKKLLNRARKEEIFLSQKIILQRISGGDMPLTATIDKGDFYTFNSVNNLVLKDDINISLNFFLGIINSKLVNWFYSLMFSNKSKLTVNISKTFLSQLPIKKATKAEQQPIIEKVQTILTQKQADPSADTSELEREIDRLVYALYGLTAEEIAIVEG